MQLYCFLLNRNKSFLYHVGIEREKVLTMDIGLENLPDLLEMLDTPLFWMNEQGDITWTNRATDALLNHLPERGAWRVMSRNLPEEYTYRLHACTWNSLAGTLVECIPDANPELSREVHRLQAANDELEHIFNASFDEVFVTDGQGVTLRVNAATERLYGLTTLELIGRSVYELERQRVFYPSVTAIALREKKRVTILQTTLDGRRLLTTANPIFDQEGKIFQVISNAKDMTDLPSTSGSIPALTPPNSVQRNPTVQPDLSTPQPDQATDTALTSANAAMKSILAMVHKVAATDSLVLLQGETGVGKDVLAQTIHHLSPRAHHAFVRIDCAAIPDTLLESELFGYERGAFTGANREGKRGYLEQAGDGTVFLDEIGEIPLHLQGKLLHFLQQRAFQRIGGARTVTVNARIIAATNRNLDQMVADGTFRADLYYRIHVVPITIPPLRERPEDIAALSALLLAKFTDRHQSGGRMLRSDTVDCLKAYAWPGNIRELESLMEYLTITVGETTITPEHLPDHVRMIALPILFTTHRTQESHSNVSGSEPSPTQGTLKKQMAAFEREIFTRAASHLSSTYAIARELEVSQPTVVRKLKRYGLR